MGDMADTPLFSSRRLRKIWAIRLILAAVAVAIAAISWGADGGIRRVNLLLSSDLSGTEIRVYFRASEGGERKLLTSVVTDDDGGAIASTRAPNQFGWIEMEAQRGDFKGHATNIVGTGDLNIETKIPIN